MHDLNERDGHEGKIKRQPQMACTEGSGVGTVRIRVGMQEVRKDSLKQMISNLRS